MDLGTEGSAPWWKTTSTPFTAAATRSYDLQVALDQLHVERLEVLAVAGREVVEHANLVAARQAERGPGSSR